MLLVEDSTKLSPSRNFSAVTQWDENAISPPSSSLLKQPVSSIRDVDPWEDTKLKIETFRSFKKEHKVVLDIAMRFGCTAIQAALQEVQGK